jgi:hypothetical protein
MYLLAASIATCSTFLAAACTSSLLEGREEGRE